jgi:hypothetical protein
MAKARDQWAMEASSLKRGKLRRPWSAHVGASVHLGLGRSIHQWTGGEQTPTIEWVEYGNAQYLPPASNASA